MEQHLKCPRSWEIQDFWRLRWWKISLVKEGCPCFKEAIRGLVISVPHIGDLETSGSPEGALRESLSTTWGP